ncbi:MAG: FG-GAP repeat protein [Anaerolineae bacterium]|nr:FG-GAP repeat protein [Anaerolineae bacterium]
MIKRLFTCMLSLVLLFSPTTSGVRAQPPAPQTALPENLAGIAGDDWWAAAQENIRQSEYHVTWQDQTYLADVAAAYHAPNRAQNLRAYFSPQSIRVIPRVFTGETPPWEWGLSLVAYGPASALQPAAPATLTANGNRIEYARGNLTEWFVNDERGLEHGFILHSPAVNAHSEDWLVLDLALTGDLTPHLTGLFAAGDVKFTTPGGVTVLRYGDLHVTDAAGRELPAHFELEGTGLRIKLNAAGASYPITVDPLATTPAWSAESNQANAYFGTSAGTAGDVNHDGFDDVIVGADFYDNGSNDEGMAFVYHGSATGLSTTPNWTAEGDQNYAQFGVAVGTAGDVNHDGYDDVIVGAHLYNNGQGDEGRAFVYHGSETGLSATPNWTAESNQDGAYFGWSVGTAGDVNHDGYDDVIVGAYLFDYAQTDEGRVYVFHGSETGLSATPNWTANGGQSGARFGWSVGTAGNVNGDSFNDVIIGAPGYSSGKADEGQARVYHGGSTGLSASPAWTAETDQANAEFGHAVGTAGDVNGDGFDDVIVGAYNYDSGQTDEGQAFVYHGGAAGVNATANWTVESNQAYAYLGYSVGTAGDVDGDGFADIIIGVYCYSNGQSDEGQARVYHGSATGLNATPDWAVESDQVEVNFGWSVGTAGDVNGDGYADVIIGAPNANNGQVGEGQAFVFIGAAKGSDTVPAWIAEGDQNNATFGYSVATAGDVNGDGYAEVIVGANSYDNGQADEGRVFVYHGAAAGLNATPNWSAESNQAGAFFGYSVATAGDVNGDGYADVIVGACYYNNGQTHEGRAFVYHGGAAGLNATAAWTAESDRIDAELGVSVGTAGDVNGDGYDDVIVGAYRYDNGLANQGRAYVFHGGPSGLNTTAAWIVDSNHAGAYFGVSVGTAGDVNGDGYADVIVGAYWYDNGQTDEGRAFVYHGSATGVSTTAAWTAESDQENAHFGVSVGTAGDVNGDGYSDVIVGANVYDNGQSDEGRAYVFHGGPTGLNAVPAWTAESDQANAHFGVAVKTAGDVNGDGYADVIIGAANYDGGQTDEGRAYIYHGGASGLSTAPDWSAESNQASANFGRAVGTAGDVNGDGFADVIASAPNYDNGQTNEGRAYVYHGGPSGLSAAPDWNAESDQADAELGSAGGTAGDVNGDGFADVIVGAPGYDGGQTDEGRALVYHGSASGLNATPAWTAESDQAGAGFGSAVGRAGDVNDDGFDDIIVGAPDQDNDQTDEGRTFVYYGSAAGLSATPAWSAEGNQTGARFGNAVAAGGDVNGDGCADVIIGAYLFDNGQTNEGRAYAYYGAATGLSAAPDWIAERNQAEAVFGASLGTAGDVNGDGFDDVIIGAHYYDNDQTDEGRAFVYHGSLTGLKSTSAWHVEGNQAYLYFGYAVGTAGDVNGDGFADVIVGVYDPRGRASVYHGSASGLRTNPAWNILGNQENAYFGVAVGTAGDVNGDGFADVIVGAEGYDNRHVNEGRALVYHGATAGLGSVPDWVADGGQIATGFGHAVGTAGDVNGDGFADVIVGAKNYDNGEQDEGGAFLYYGNGSAGLDILPRQLRTDGSTPIAHLGMSDSHTDFQLRLTGRMPLGREEVRLQWQAAPLGTPITATAALNGVSDWTDTQTTGVAIAQTVAGLVRDTPYHWRVRLLYRPGNVLGQTASRWIHIPFGSWNETTLRSASNQPPIANAGPDQVVEANVTVTLNGSASTDPDGNYPLAYHWSQIGGTPVSFTPNLTVTTFTAPSSPTTLIFALVVTDSLGRADPSPDTVNVAVANHPPVADAGADQSVDTNAVVTLDGSASSDPDGDPLTYSWTQTGGPALTFSSDLSVTTFTAPSDPAVFTFTLAVTDSLDLPDPTPDELVVTVNNRPPVADAGSNQSVDTNAAVTLDGSASSDPDGDTPLTYGWTQTGGAPVSFAPNLSVITFTAPSDPGILTFALVVTDSLGLPDPTPDTVEITVNNRPPIANAGADQTVDTNVNVTLDGSASTDPDGDTPLAYRWTQTGGTIVTFAPDLAVTTFTAPPDAAVLTFTLSVTDSLGLPGLTPDEVVVTVIPGHINQPPVADAGPDQTVYDNVAITLNGSASSDPDGNPLAYGWAQTGGPAVAFTPHLSVTVFTPPLGPEVLTFTLSVTDSLNMPDPTPDEVVITVLPAPVNQPPVANAGTDQIVYTDATVTLDGSASTDPDGDTPLTYGWTQTGGPEVSFTANLSITTFTAPSDPAVLTFALVVTDSLGMPDPTPDTVTVTVNNQPPVASAGADQTVDANVIVSLDGSASSDPDGDTPLTYHWTQTGGPTVSFTPNLSVTTFTAPAAATTLTFTLSVTDALGLPDLTPDAVVVTAIPGHINQPPVADAGPDQTVNPNAPVTLDGSASSDPDGNPLTYRWTQTGGPAVDFAANLSVTTFTAPGAAAVLTFTLSVTDSLGLPDLTPDEIVVSVQASRAIFLPLVLRQYTF